MRDPWNDSEMVARFRAHERDSLPRAPLNAALCGVIARHASLSSLLAHAPLEQRLPVLLLASIHFLVLQEPHHELALWYPNVTADPREPDDQRLDDVLVSFVNDRRPSMLHLLSTRRVQTNEIGRCSLLLAGITAFASDVGPMEHIDVGTSAGLTTLLPRFSYRYDDGPTIGSAGPLLDCSTRGDRASPTTIPTIERSRGIDIDPIDVTDADDARWLQACCWPDQTDRFERLASAIELARRHPPEIVVGGAVELVRSTVGSVPGDLHPVLTSSWVMNYLQPAERRAFLHELDLVGRDRDLSYVFAESPALTPELPHADDQRGEHTTALSVLRWSEGRRSDHHLATCHPHGYWIHWR